MNEVAENISRVAYVFGVLESKGEIKLEVSSNDELFEIWKNIYEDWGNYKDIKSDDEEGYVIPYAQRILLDKYGVDK